MNDSPERSPVQDTRPIQRVMVGVHLGNEMLRFAPTLHPADHDSDIARIEVVDGLAIQSDNAATFRTLAELFTRGADSIDSAKAEAERSTLSNAEDQAWLESKPEPVA